MDHQVRERAKTSLDKRKPSAASNKPSSDCETASAASKVFGTAELLDWINGSRTDQEILKSRGTASDWNRSAVGVIARRGGLESTVAVPFTDISKLCDPLATSHMGLRPMIKHLRVCPDLSSHSKISIAPRFPSKPWGKVGSILPALETIQGVSQLGDNVSTLSKEVVIKLERGRGFCFASYEDDAEESVAAMDTLSTPEFDWLLPEEVIRVRRLSQYIPADTAKAKRLLSRPLPRLSRAHLRSNPPPDATSDADLIKSLVFLDYKHQSTHGRSIPSVSLTFGAQGPAFDYVGTIQKLGPYGAAVTNAGASSDKGIRELKLHVHNMSRCRSLTDCLTNQSLFDASTGLEAIRIPVQADAIDGPSRLSIAAPVTFPPSLKSIVVAVPSRAFKDGTMINAEALSRYMSTCDPTGAVVIRAESSGSLESSPELNVYMRDLRAYEKRRTELCSAPSS